MRIEKRFFLIPLAGLGSGLVNGLLGAGGGILLVLSMQALWQDTPQDVLANALCVTLPTTAVSSPLYLKNGSLPTEGFAPFILPALLGGIVGGLLIGKLKGRTLQKLFAALVTVSGVLMVIR